MTTLSATPSPTVSTRPGSPWPALVTAYAGVFLTISDLFKVLIAVPAIQRDLNASPAVGQFVLAGFQLTYAVTLVTGGRLGDRCGRRRIFCAGIALFTLASLASGLAPNAGWLIGARLVQGVGSALALPQAFSLVQVLFAPTDRDRPFAVMGAVLGLSSVAGQVAGGLLLQALPWRYVFLVNLPLGLAILIAGRRFIPESRAAHSARIDGAGVVVLTGALTLLVLPLIEGRQLGWPLWTWISLAAAPLALAAFALFEHRIRDRGPLVDLRLFADGTFTLGAVVVLGWYMMVNGLNFTMALDLQNGLGRSALAAGLAFAPFALSFLVSSLAAGRLAPRLGRRLLVLGALITAAGFTTLIAVAYGRGLGVTGLILITLVLGTGMGFVQTPLLNEALKGVREDHVGTASGVLSTAQQIGGSLGVASVGIVFFRALGDAPVGDASSWTNAFAAGAGFGLALVVICLALLVALLRRRTT